MPYVTSKMSRNRFTEKKKFLHVADNDKITAGDKIYKVRPLMEMVNLKLQQFGIFSRSPANSYAWRLHISCGGTFDQLSFRRSIVRQLMQSLGNIVPATGPSITPLDVIRYDGIGHFLESSKQLRCKLCKSNARLKCIKCNVSLHLHCAMKYHTP
jgi:hypothetical protein